MNSTQAILSIYEYLVKNSSPAHHVTTSELRDSCGVKDRRAVYSICRDIAAYRSDLVQEQHFGKDNEYYFTGSALEYSEALSLAVSLQTCISVSQKDTDALIEKIAEVAGGEVRDRIRDSKFDFNLTKHTNENSVYVINEITEALNAGKKISFKYYHVNPDGTEYVSNDGKPYMLDPLAVVADYDRWYLICYDSRIDGNLRTFRIDRIKKVSVIESRNVTKKAEAFREQIAEDLKLSFKVFRGTPETVTLRFRREMTGSVFDHFGEETEIEKLDGEWCRATVRAGVSPQFFAWICGGSGMMKIDGPDRVKEQFGEFLKKLAEE